MLEIIAVVTVLPITGILVTMATNKLMEVGINE